MLFKEVKPLLDKLKITSPTEYEELKWLYRQACYAVCRFENIELIECGTLNAASAITIGAAIKYAMAGDAIRVGHLTTVDNYLAYKKDNRPGTLSPDEIKEKIALADMSDIITPIEADANDFLKTLEPDSIGMLWLDAWHSYEHVKQNLDIGLPKMKNNGCICGHDYCWRGAGVVMAVEEFKARENTLCGFGTHWKIWWTLVNRSGG